MNYLNELLTILNEMSPYLILGFFISGLLHVYVPKNLYARFLHRKGFRSVVGAALLGVPIPLCSCGVIPTAMSLKKEGASDGATVAFLVGTPQTGVDSILATYSLLGLPFAIIRPIASLCVGIFGGVLVDKFGSEKNKKIDYSKMKFSSQPATDTHHSHIHTCGCGCDHSTPQKPSLKAALRYGFVEIMGDFGKWLIVGLFIAAAITAFVPDSVFVMFREHYMLNILLILLVSVPMYICATGSVPIALSLMLKGISPGAAFVLLLAGPATNIASLIILKREIGMRKTIIYLISIVIGAITCAIIIDLVLPQEWFSSIMPMDICCDHTHDHIHDHAHSHENCSHGPIWWQTICSTLFVILFLNSIVRSWINGKSSCCKNNH
ncbi:MAG: SO_0444 family Cu/Zn efflux transporter [Rikenellaceae bacterium]